ncbi:MAG TPA: SAM-dependent methyltransferase [Ruminiclostridium sp.]
MILYIPEAQEIIGFHHRRKIEYEVGFNILGMAEMTDPEITFGITKIEDKWIFGKCESNDREWLQHDYKPFSYSNALKVNISRALVNIAVGNNLKCTVIDPCCGIGTVLIEALSMGIDIKGYEINPSIGTNAKENLLHFGYEDVITICDMSTTKDKFDVAIVDLPYGIFTKTTPVDQLAIIANTRRLANRMILIAFDNMDAQVLSSNFTIEDKFIISKGKFKRLVSICT